MPQRPSIKFPRVQQQAPLPPEGMEFFVQPGGAPGLRKIGTGQRDTEFERTIANLPPAEQEKARRIRAGLAGRAGVVAGAKAGKPSQRVSIGLDPGAPQRGDVQVEIAKPSDVKTFREIEEKRRNRPAAVADKRTQELNKREDRIFKLQGMIQEILIDPTAGVDPKILQAALEADPQAKAVKLDPKTAIQVRRIKSIEQVLAREQLEYQRAAGTDGILTEGGPATPGTASNRYMPASEAEMNFLEPGDIFLDPNGDERQWKGTEIQEGVSPEVLHAEREEYIKTHPKPKAKTKVKKAGGFPDKPTKPSEPGKPPKTEAELRKQIDGITKLLADSTKLTLDRTGKTRAKFEKRLERLKAELEKLTK